MPRASCQGISQTALLLRTAPPIDTARPQCDEERPVCVGAAYSIKIGSDLTRLTLCRTTVIDTTSPVSMTETCSRPRRRPACRNPCSVPHLTAVLLTQAFLLHHCSLLGAPFLSCTGSSGHSTTSPLPPVTLCLAAISQASENAGLSLFQS